MPTSHTPGRMKILKPVPPEDQVAAFYRDAIDRDVLSHGDRLPGRRTLRQQWGVSNEVIRRAFAQLAADGYIAAQSGNGTFAIGREHRKKTAA